jgi:hypothetical protein
MDDLNQAIREAEEFLTQAKSEEIREVLRRKYYELLKRKYEGSVGVEVPTISGESSESKVPGHSVEPSKLADSDLTKIHDPKDTDKSCEQGRAETENLTESGLPKVVDKLVKYNKLHALTKFKVDEDTIRSFYERYKGRIHDIFVNLAKFLPKYFENNTELLKYVQNKCYVSLRVKVIFSKENDEQVDEYFVPHQHKRRYLAQSLSDLTEIMIDQAPIIEGNISEFIRHGSGYVVTGIKSLKLEVTPFRPGIQKARGYILLYPWLQHRRGIVNIRNKDSLCFWKCLYRAFYPDPKRHDFRDVPGRDLQEFMVQQGFDFSIFEHGYTTESLATFEERCGISINIYDIGKNGPEETKPYSARFITVIRTLERLIWELFVTMRKRFILFS